MNSKKKSQKVQKSSSQKSRPVRVKHPNPYRVGSLYAVGFNFIARVKRGILCKSELVDFFIDEVKSRRLALGSVPANLVKRYPTFADYISAEALRKSALSSANVLLSPQESSERGDCRGNMASAGHLYFLNRCKKVKGQENKLALRWRKEPLEPYSRYKKVADSIAHEIDLKQAVVESVKSKKVSAD